MPRYRLFLPVRAVSYYRLPDTGVTAEGIHVTPGQEPTYTVQVDAIGPNAEAGYTQATYFPHIWSSFSPNFRAGQLSGHSCQRVARAA